MIVVDASVLVDAVIGAAAGSERLSGVPLAAPAIVDGEAGSAVRRLWRHGSLDDERATVAIDALVALEILRFEHRALLPRAWQLRHNVTVTDALYIALAEQLDVPLVTFDARMAVSPGIKANVEVLGRG